MSQSDSFIEEVTEEVRRDRLYALLRKYGWIGVLVVLLIVGGAAWREYAAAQARAQAQSFGDSILDALENDDTEARLAALASIEAPDPEARALLSMLSSEQAVDLGDVEDAVALLGTVADDSAVTPVYRQVARYKALLRGGDVLTADERRMGFEELAIPGQPLRLLAEEQLALLDIEAGDSDGALARLTAMVDDSEATAGLRRRAAQLIVALGGSLDDDG